MSVAGGTVPRWLARCPPVLGSRIKSPSARSTNSFGGSRHLIRRRESLIAAGGLVIGLLAGNRSMIVDGPVWVGFAVVAAVTASLILALLAFTTRRYDAAPNPDAAIRLMTADPEWLEWRFLGNLRDAIGANRGKLGTKTRLLSAALVGLLVGAALLGGYLLTDTLTTGR